MTEQKASEKKTAQRWYRYGYFARKANGVLTPAPGNYSSLSPNVYKIGDIEAGGPGRVVEIIKGEAANQMGYDVAVIVDADTNTARVSKNPPLWALSK